MDRNIIQEFQRLRVLTHCDYQRMDELVQDLTNALEESSSYPTNSTKTKKRLIRKKRSLKSLGSSNVAALVSEDSEASIDGQQLGSAGKNLLLLSDSDDISSASRISWTLHSTSCSHGNGGTSCSHGNGGNGTSCSYGNGGTLSSTTTSNRPCFVPKGIAGNMAESDSVNENFSPFRPHRRKRKFKRMAVDPSPTSPQSLAESKHRHKSKLCVGSGVAGMVCGKRKRSMRERSVEHMDTDTVSMPPPRTAAKGKLVDDCMMDCLDGSVKIESGASSLSSSESDGGVYTNDEGREGDDEQSDYSCEVGGWWDLERSVDDQDSDSDPAFKAILTGSLQHLSARSRQQFKLQISKLSDMGREMRAGRRRLGERTPPAPNTINEKISKFLRDPQQKELWLQPSGGQEKDQLNRLAALYSLSIHREGTSTHQSYVLTRTRSSCLLNGDPGLQPVAANVGDIKRRRRTPPTIAATLVGENAAPIPESNVGSRMLRSMGWEPGTGLGATGQGIQVPIAAHVRPRKQGLGHGSKSN